ncbi:hypothetical protein EYZ11_004998 [Aspergillus tanneri]|uniref:Uncharacterized protein n=1 Tax=Aspergillus tanneri TaxID=1220188 RepID=A0A4S3JJ41_9EURO|nr:hypothetical protein EYZ11_004998 [Aspergillus tanneri]
MEKTIDDFHHQLSQHPDKNGQGQQAEHRQFPRPARKLAKARPLHLHFIHLAFPRAVSSATPLFGALYTPFAIALGLPFPFPSPRILLFVAYRPLSSSFSPDPAHIITKPFAKV